MSSLWVYQWLKRAWNGSHNAGGDSLPATHAGYPGSNLLTPNRRDTTNTVAKIVGKREAAWWSNGRFRMRDSCGKQTIVLRRRARSHGMVSICFTCAQRKLWNSARTPRIAHSEKCKEIGGAGISFDVREQWPTHRPVFSVRGSSPQNCTLVQSTQPLWWKEKKPKNVQAIPPLFPHPPPSIWKY